MFKFEPVNSNMYIIIICNNAIVIDPVHSQEAIDYLNKKNIVNVLILLTHEHYDHTNGIPNLINNYNCKIICHSKCGIALEKGKNNRPIIIASMIMSNLVSDLSFSIDKLPSNYFVTPDETFEVMKEFFWKGYLIRMVSTPGHTSGSCCIEFDNKYVFTGDTLILNEKVITRFPTGSKEEFKNITLPYLNSLHSNYIIMPGHGNQFCIEDKYFDELELH